MRTFLIPLLLLMLSGCVTSVTVSPGASDDGITYSLPQTYLLVTPAADGTVNYQWLYLPDERHQYTVKSSAFLAKYTSDLQLENGLLKQFGGQQDTTDVTSQLAKSLATIAAGKSSSSSSDSSGNNGGGGKGNNGGNQSGGNQNGGTTNSNGGTNNNANGGTGGDKGAQTATPSPSDNSKGQGPTIVAGRVAAAYGPVLFRVDFAADNSVTLVPVDFPAVTTKVTGGSSVTNSAGPQALMEANELAHQVSFGAVKVAGALLSTTSDYPIDPDSISNIQITDAKTKSAANVTVTSGITSGVGGGSTVTFAVTGTLKPGDYLLSFQYNEKNHPQPQSASLSFSVKAP